MPQNGGKQPEVGSRLLSCGEGSRGKSRGNWQWKTLNGNHLLQILIPNQILYFKQPFQISLWKIACSRNPEPALEFFNIYIFISYSSPFFRHFIPPVTEQIFISISWNRWLLNILLLCHLKRKPKNQLLQSRFCDKYLGGWIKVKLRGFEVDFHLM